MSIPLHIWMSVLGAIGILSSIETLKLKFYHGSLHNYTETPADDPLRILPFFDRSLVSMFYIFGFNETADSLDATVMLSVYLKTRHTNVILLDWSNETRADGTGAVLSYIFKAVPNARRVGRCFGQALLMFIGNGIDSNKIHLVGHSLGAHVAGYAGEFLKDNNLELARITGLDPAGPLFEGIVNMGGLNPSRASFVDILHTNPGQLGNTNSIGSVDFWANCNDALQPGCPDDKHITNDMDPFCSHWRSFLIFAESILRPENFPAAKAENCNDWHDQKNYSHHIIIYLGDLVDTSARGNYYFSTRSNEPFSEGQKGVAPNNQNRK